MSQGERVSDWVERVRWNLARSWESVRGARIDLDSYRPGEHGSLISFSGVPGYEEVERYWLNAPYAFVSINYDEDENEYLYYAVEPELDEFEQSLLDNLFADIRDSLIYSGQYDAETAEDSIKLQMKDLIEEYGVVVDMNTLYRLFYYIYRNFEGFE
ncbi:MAG: type II secretion system protein, partial [Halobacteriaceae archaeon]